MNEPGPLRILFIDDNPDDSLLMITELRRDFPDAQMEQISGSKELDAAMDRGDFDLVVTDYQLGWTNGIQILRTIKERWPYCPVIMATGTGSEEIAVEAMKAGLDDYILKSVKHLVRFPASVRSVIEHSRRCRELRESDSKLREQLHFLQRLIDTIPSGIFYKDAQGVYQGCNTAFENTFGFRREEIVGKTVHDLFPRELAADYAQKDRELIEHPGVQSFETVIECADRTRREAIVSRAVFTDLGGSVTGLVGIVLDTTEKKRAEEERVRLITAMEQVAEGIVITDADWTVQYVNPAFEKMSGYSRDEIIGQRLHTLEGNNYEKAFYHDKGMTWTGQFTRRCKDGSPLDVDACFTTIHDSQRTEKIVNYVGVFRDITQEVKLQRLLRQAQKMEAIGTLAGGIAHDFNNILGAIMGFTELVMYELGEKHQVCPGLKQVIKASHRAKDLVSQILTFSRQADQEHQATQVSLIVKEALKLLRSSLPTTIEIQQHIKSTAMAMADPTQIHQILMNLCSNAAHAMQAKGGVLDVTLEDVDLEPDPDVMTQYPGLLPGPYLQLTVSDTGHGIDPVIMDRIFDPYFTTKDIGEGTGLGLAVVHGIVQSHGGSIKVYSEPDEGTTFKVFLPRLLSAVEKASREQSDLPIPTGHERLLFIDDERALVDVGQQMLQRLGYEVIGKTSSLEGLEAFRAEPGSFDVVITDQTMPQMTGIDLSREILRIRPDIPIIICTGFSTTLGQTSEKAKSMGITDFIMKPIVLRQLAEMIRRVLSRERTEEREIIPEG